MTDISQTERLAHRPSDATRWTQLIIGIVCMVMIANLQYGWTLFTIPISQKHGWGLASIQVAFTLFVLFETWLVPFEGYLVDRFGPRIIVFIGGLLTGLAWVLNSFADSLAMLYAAQIIGGIGAGAVYGTCVGNALKWFPDRRGFAAGLTAAGFGIGSALTIIPIQKMISTHGYETTFFNFGIGQGLVVVLLALLLFAPQPDQVPASTSRLVQQGRVQFEPRQVLKEPTFWIMYVMFVLMAVGGLMATAQLKPIAKDFHLDTLPVTLIGITLPALATCTDCFGIKYATTNAGLLYTAKGTASLLVPLANVLVLQTGGWKSAFIIASVFNLMAAFMAIFVLKPMRQKLVTHRSGAPALATG